jgi:hypothetical protein
MRFLRDQRRGESEERSENQVHEEAPRSEPAEDSASIALSMVRRRTARELANRALGLLVRELALLAALDGEVLGPRSFGPWR